jgi:anthranilate phosphoribosyltransferase
VLDNITPETLTGVYAKSNYAFLFAPVFHPGMRYVAPIRKELGWRTIFNLLGPLSNPVDTTSAVTQAPLLEARVIGVARRDLGPEFAHALVLSGVRKAMVVCGDEELDEVSCAGKTHCWRLVEGPNPEYKGPAAVSGGAVTGDADDGNGDDSDDEEEAVPRTVVRVEYFTLTPTDFGLPPHPLSTVSPGKAPRENAGIFMRILQNKMPADDAILHFVLMNTAALFVVSGICEADTSNLGDGDDGAVVTERGPGGGRWKEGVRRARWAVESGRALAEWGRFVDATRAAKQS